MRLGNLNITSCLDCLKDASSTACTCSMAGISCALWQLSCGPASWFASSLQLEVNTLEPCETRIRFAGWKSMRKIYG